MDGHWGSPPQPSSPQPPALPAPAAQPAAEHGNAVDGQARASASASASTSTSPKPSPSSAPLERTKTRHRRVWSQPVMMMDPLALLTDPRARRGNDAGAAFSGQGHQGVQTSGVNIPRQSAAHARSEYGGTPVGRLSHDAKNEIRRTYSATSATSSSPSGSAKEPKGEHNNRKAIESPRKRMVTRSVAGVLDSTTLENYHMRQVKRLHVLECIEFDKVGDFRVRKVSRADILREVARDHSVVSLEMENAFFDEAISRSNLNLRKRGVQQEKRKKKRGATFLRNALHARDIRQVDPAFKGKPALWVRYKALVVSLNGVRAIIFHNKMFVFEIQGRDPSTLVNIIRMRISTSDLEYGDDDELNTPFEFRALEGILIGVCLGLEHDFVKLEPPIQKIVEIMGSRISVDKLEALRMLELKLNGFISRAKAVKAVLADLLEEDEEMSNMYLTEIQKHPLETRNPLDHEKAEILLESYLQVIDDLTSRADLLADSIDDAEGLFRIHLDAVQNRLLLVDLIISAFTLLFGLGTLIGGVFGMNFPFSALWQELPSSQYFFIGVVVFYFVTFMLGAWSFFTYSKRKKLWGRTRSILERM